MVFAENGFKVCFYNKPMSTPVLSYTVREKNASCGIVITPSHNPKDITDIKMENRLNAKSQAVA